MQGNASLAGALAERVLAARSTGELDDGSTASCETSGKTSRMTSGRAKVRAAATAWIGSGGKGASMHVAACGGRRQGVDGGSSGSSGATASVPSWPCCHTSEGCTGRGHVSPTVSLSDRSVRLKSSPRRTRRTSVSSSIFHRTSVSSAESCRTYVSSSESCRTSVRNAVSRRTSLSSAVSRQGRRAECSRWTCVSRGVGCCRSSGAVSGCSGTVGRTSNGYQLLVAAACGTSVRLRQESSRVSAGSGCWSSGACRVVAIARSEAVTGTAAGGRGAGVKVHAGHLNGVGPCARVASWSRSARLRGGCSRTGGEHCSGYLDRLAMVW